MGGGCWRFPLRAQELIIQAPKLMNKTGRNPWIEGPAQAVPESVVRVTDTERRLRVDCGGWEETR